ncbi:prepilin-type N-terminal cleavage/methylation domain-containing protein [Burkholderiales bacterium JOSHI_001]|nr:prepilin-type N-terminal cleavage/methylation domain-containing protein [Burkholderiales bacterium JOSHI_001]
MPKRTRGFTLMEVLVALFIMALMAAMAWQGVDAMVRSRDQAQASSQRYLLLATVLAQWERDLSSVHDSGAVPPLLCDGTNLRMTRRAEGGLQVVVWNLENNQWRRWAGPVTTRVADLQESWMRSQQLLPNDPGQLRLLDGASSWQVYYFQGQDNNWSNCGSSADLTPVAPPPPAASGASAPAQAAPPRAQLPSGVRLVLDLDSGKLTRDLVLLP